jgi:CheY-like chemotaxis protein
MNIEPSPAPLPEPASTPSQVGPVPAGAPEPRVYTALLVDDEELIRSVVTRFLEGVRFVVFTAAHGIQALDIARRRSERIDVLLTDLSMPKMDGRELVREMRRIHPETKVIFLSGHPDAMLPGEEAADPSIPFLPKPCTGEQLKAMLREVLPDWQEPLAQTTCWTA